MTQILSKILPIRVDENAANVLNEFHSYSYSWRLFMVNELQFRKARYNLSQVEQITIAETGATSIFIDSVELDVSYAPNQNTLTAGRTMVKVDILEPSGAGFFDLIYASAAELQIRNWSKLPFYLELSFNGYDEEGNVIKKYGNLDPWRFRLIVTGISTEIDEGGSRYGIEAYSANDEAISERYGTLPKAFNFFGNTFLEMMADLENKWNEYELEKNRESISALTQYKFVFYKDPSVNPNFNIDWSKIRVQSYDANRPSRKRIYTNEGEALEKGSFTQGYSVAKIMESLLAASTLSEDMRKNYPDAYSDDPDLAEKLTNISKTYKIETQVVHTAYDVLSNDYERLVIYHIWPFDGISQIMRASSTSSSADSGNLPVSEKRRLEAAKKQVQHYQNQRTVRRVYDYIFTGKNIDILRLDLKFNTFWKVFLSEFGKGETKNIGVDSRNLNNPNLTPDQTAQSLITQIEQARGNPNQLQALALRSGQVIAELKKEASQLRRQAEEQRDLAAAALALNLESRSQAIINTGILNIGRDAGAASAANLEDLNVRARYAEDLPSEGGSFVPTIVPIATGSSSTESAENTNQGIETHFHTGTNFFSSLMNQLYSTRWHSDWMQINLEIRGDPHWLGYDQLKKFIDNYTTVTERDYTTRKQNGRELVNRVSADQMVVPLDGLPPGLRSHINGEEKEEPYNTPRYEIAEQACIINFYTPNIFRDPNEFINSTDGTNRVHTKSGFISGLYVVYQIKHKFQDGLFTQEISARRDPHTANFSLSEWSGSLDQAEQELAKTLATGERANSSRQATQSSQSSANTVPNTTSSNPGPPGPVSNFSVSSSGRDLIADVEGAQNTVYLDVAGKETIGVGHLLTDAEKASGEIIINGQPVNWQNGLSDQQMDQLLSQDIKRFENVVRDNVSVDLNQDQFDSLVSFSYNVGPDAFQKSTLLRKLNAGQINEVPAEMSRWKFAGGNVVPGLVNRRNKEIARFKGST